MDFLQLTGKSILIFGVANRKSVAWHIGRVLAEAGAKCVYVVQNDDVRQNVAKLLGNEDDLRLRRRARRPDRPAPRRTCRRGRQVPRPGPFAGVRRLLRGRQAVPRDPKKAFLQAVDISCYSLIALVQRPERPAGRPTPRW